MIDVEISYIIPKPDVNDDVVAELERAVGELHADERDPDTRESLIASHLDYEGNVAVMSVYRKSRLDSLAQYQHRADVMASAVLARCSQDMQERIRGHFAGVARPSVDLIQE